jgi:hypothetical protein
VLYIVLADKEQPMYWHLFSILTIQVVRVLLRNENINVNLQVVAHGGTALHGTK